jgi:hypothetical protein
VTGTNHDPRQTASYDGWDEPLRPSPTAPDEPPEHERRPAPPSALNTWLTHRHQYRWPPDAESYFPGYLVGCAIVLLLIAALLTFLQLSGWGIGPRL